MTVDGASHYPHVEMVDLVAPRMLSFVEGLKNTGSKVVSLRTAS